MHISPKLQTAIDDTNIMSKAWNILLTKILNSQTQARSVSSGPDMRIIT